MKIRIVVWGSVVFMLTATTVPGQRREPPPEPGWVGLYSRALIDWLENENQLKRLCPDNPMNTYDAERCRDQKRAALPFLVPLYSGPVRAAATRGAILLVATPGRSLRFFHSSPNGGVPKEFEPDLNMQDWGYGPYFHQTYLARKGDWFELPEDPFPPGTWFNAADLGEPANVMLLGGLVEGPLGSLMILEVGRDVVRARSEQAADMWCEAGDPPPLKPWTEIRIPIAELYDKRGHLVLSPSYMKGC
jgi:hypothetical protein